MTRDEANKVAEVLASADGHCWHCATDLAELAQDEFPQFDWEKMVVDALTRHRNRFSQPA